MSEPNESQPSKEQQKNSGQVVGIQHSHISSPKNSKKRLIFAGIFGLILIIAGVFYATQNNESSSQSKETYYLSGTTKGKGMSFDRYNFFTEPVSSDGLPTKATFIQTEKSGDKTTNIAYLSGLIKDISPGPTKDSAESTSTKYAKVINDNLSKNPTDVGYKNSIKSVSAFVKMVFGKEVVVTLGNAKPYTNDTIKNDAWQFEVTIVGNAFDGIQPQKGSVVIAIGQSSSYYFLVSATESNLAKNTKTFADILASLKIDQ